MLAYDSPAAYDTPSFAYDGEQTVMRIEGQRALFLAEIKRSSRVALTDVAAGIVLYIRDSDARTAALADQEGARAVMLADVKGSRRAGL